MSSSLSFFDQLGISPKLAYDAMIQPGSAAHKEVGVQLLRFLERTRGMGSQTSTPSGPPRA